jgi:hypothetical protein
LIAVNSARRIQPSAFADETRSRLAISGGVRNRSASLGILNMAQPNALAVLAINLVESG